MTHSTNAELPEEPNPWQVHAVRTDYENPYMEIRHHAVTRPDGAPGDYWVARFRRIAVGIIPVDDEGCTWLVGQYRFPTGTYEWEIPEGGADPGEEPEACAKRELREETGLTASHFKEILHLQLSNSCTNELSYTYLATGLSLAEAEPDATEKLQVLRLPVAEAIQLAIEGKLRDGITVASLLKLHALLLQQPNLLKSAVS